MDPLGRPHRRGSLSKTGNVFLGVELRGSEMVAMLTHTRLLLIKSRRIATEWDIPLMCMLLPLLHMHLGACVSSIA